MSVLITVRVYMLEGCVKVYISMHVTEHYFRNGGGT